MAVLKNKTQGNYTIVSQNIMRDKNLSLSERGMLLTLLSLPDNWHLTIMGLCQILPDGKDKISRTLNSLIEKGYVTRIQGRGNGGRFDSTDLEVHETPIVSPHPENPHTADQDTDEPHTDNPSQYITYISNNQAENNNKECNAGTLSGAEYDALVSEYGRSNVDYQIKRITDHGYKGCLNFTTIKKWCTERLHRNPVSRDVPSKKCIFLDYSQRDDYDFNKLERLLVCN